MISIDLDLTNKRKVTHIDFIGQVTFPSGYFAHLLRGLDYTTFIPFIRLKPQRLFFIYWQPYTENSLILDYLSDLRTRLVYKYYTGDLMSVKDYKILEFKGKEAHYLYGFWENSKIRMKGIYELMALQHNDFLVLFDVSTTDRGSNGESLQELMNIRETFELS
ncbi:MAG: hypothetical protein ACW96U_13405 [Candidatus Heimdallarchaeaceae archaeon]|jgi:hypothetical protein